MSDIHSNPKEERRKKKEEKAPAAQGKSETALREEEMLAFWREHDIFNKSIQYPGGTSVGPAQLSSDGAEETKADKDFVFYDGPPFATGLPHYGHHLPGTIKDAIPRFWTMNGYRVRRKWGWDCHGLPLENLIEKELGLATKRDIEEFGIQNFNEKARAAVLRYADDWRRIIPRMGRWVDMDDDYRTMDPAYTESVWWVFKTLNEKGLVYESFKSMHLCPRCGTTLSNFEVNQGYKDIKDIAVTVKLPLLDENGEKTDTSLLVWTTTPWTLPGNMAAAVHNEVVYSKVRIKKEESENHIENEEGKSECVVLAKERLEQLGDIEQELVEEFKGEELVGKKYEPPFPYHSVREFENKENAWKIYHAPYVELGDEGTGAVHLAPAYGEEDMELAKEHNIPLVHHVDEEGHFMPFVTDFAGRLAKPKDDDDAGVTHLDADIEVTRKLKEDGKLFRKEKITHSYPHCWRCDTPLLNYATTSWFVEVTKIRDELVKENKKVHWVPEHVGRSRFGKWLEGARDWAISRQRYWGAPLPVWRNPQTKEYKVIGSLAELQEYVPKSGNTYLLMRHGESESNKHDRASTRLDDHNPLTEAGVEEVKAAIRELKGKKPSVIISSPYERTKETAELVAKELGMKIEDIIYDERIGEIKLGNFDGKQNSEYHQFLLSHGGWHTARPEGGESWGDVKTRVGDFLFDIDTKYKDETILIISHNCPLRMLGVVNEGETLFGTDFDHDDEGKRYGNGEVRELPFKPFPHNDAYELDYHRPYIDQIELYDDPVRADAASPVRDRDLQDPGSSKVDVSNGASATSNGARGTKLERVPDVFDCWFESGSMPYAETHYPFENLDVTDIEKGVRYPADFIAESIDQTRGWFYSLMVLGVALTGRSPYKNVITNGLVLAEDGKKMSKKLQNYPDPMELVARQGADSMRFYLLSSSIIKGEDLNFSEKEVQELQRKNIGRLHNVLAMYETYKDPSQKSKVKSQKSKHVLDRWIVARLNELITESTAGYKNYELDKATRPITDFIDDLSVWYLRRSRDRLKGQDTEDKQAALATLRYVLQNLALVMAPPMPFYAEYLWQRVKTEDDAESVHLAKWPREEEIDKDIIGMMSFVRDFVSDGLQQRAEKGIKVRQPLNAFYIKHSVKEPKYWDEMVPLLRDELNVKEVKFDSQREPGGPPTYFDWDITPELKAEGDAREFMRQVQDMRKKAGLNPQDRIVLTVQTFDDGEELIRSFENDIKKTVGADDIQFVDVEGEEVTAGEHSFTVELKKT